MSDGNRFFEGLAVGSILGFFCGLFSAPKPGRELRKELLSESEDLYKQAAESVADIKAKTDQAIATLQAKSEDLVKTAAESFPRKRKGRRNAAFKLNLRLNQAIAACGFCSRRAADKLIAEHRVKVNGRSVSDFSYMVNLDKDKLAIAGKTISVRSNQYVLLHKPVRVISTCKDEHGRKSITDLLPPNLRHLKPAGRLDYDSSGLVLLTNDGALIQSLTHPKAGIEKMYQLTVSGKCNAMAAKELADGINFKEAKTAKAKVKLLESNERRSIIEITITEGKNRQLRRMCAQLGLPVIELARKSIDKLQLSNLAPGKWRYVTKSEIIALTKKLNNMVDLTRK